MINKDQQAAIRDAFRALRALGITGTITINYDTPKVNSGVIGTFFNMKTSYPGSYSTYTVDALALALSDAEWLKDEIAKQHEEERLEQFAEALKVRGWHVEPPEDDA